MDPQVTPVPSAGTGDRLRLERWASDLGVDGETHVLGVSLADRRVAMAHSVATGESLVSNGALGADVIHLAAGEGFVPHTHPGHHLLIVIGGDGTITYGGHIYPTSAGQIYLIEGEVPHAVGAITDHVILAVGSPHLPVDSEGRMTPTEYETVTAEIRELTCLICDKTARYPEYLHAVGCAHCPCGTCVPLPASDRSGSHVR